MKQTITDNYTQIVELNGQKVQVQFTVTATLSYQPAQISGPPEKCYPAESDFALETLRIDSAVNVVTGKRLILELGTICQLRAAINEEHLAEQMWKDFDLACEPADEN